MIKDITLRLLPHEVTDDDTLKQAIAQAVGVPVRAITGYHILKHSLDARSRTIWANVSLQAYVNEPFYQRPLTTFQFQDVSASPKKVIIIGAGPAGLFAALRLIELGIQPVVLERGKDVRARRRDLAALNREGKVNAESNYCFGEGGAGTYSDGKLYTRSTKRGQCVPHLATTPCIWGPKKRTLRSASTHWYQQTTADYNRHAAADYR